MKLTLAERWGAIVTLASIKQGKLKALRLAKTALETLRITEDEKKEFGVIVQGNTVSWNTEASKQEKEFTFDKEMISNLKNLLQAMNDQGVLSSELIDIAEKLGVA